MTIIFETPGLIDIRSFTTFGLNSKPNARNPIGFFGTGLKYAVAVLAREKIAVRLFIGEVEYKFFMEETSFRGDTFQAVKMQRRHGLLSAWTKEDLPFTTELGKKWKLWQVFRELYANTKDEGGIIFKADVAAPIIGHTVIAVDSLDFEEEYNKRDEIFLPEHDPDAVEVQVIKRPSKYVYWRGMRVLDLNDKEQSIYTYNIMSPIDLTEDRTAKYSWVINIKIAAHIARSDDRQLIESAVKADNGTYESHLDWKFSSVAPNSTYLDVVASLSRNSVVRPSVSSYYKTYAPRSSNLTPRSLRQQIVDCVKNGEFDDLVLLIDSDRDAFLALLKEEEADAQLSTSAIELRADTSSGFGSEGSF